jgi:hypothetical protein
MAGISDAVAGPLSPTLCQRPHKLKEEQPFCFREERGATGQTLERFRITAGQEAKIEALVGRLATLAQEVRHQIRQQATGAPEQAAAAVVALNC